MRDSSANLAKKFEIFMKLETDNPDWSCAEYAQRLGVARGTIFRWKQKLAVQRGALEPIHSICFDLPQSVAESFAVLCKREGVHKSERLREMVLAELARKKTRARRR
jgi:transposase-like protein